MMLGTGVIGSPKRAEIAWAGGGSQGNDAPTHNFTVDLGPEHATRHVLVCTYVTNSNNQTGDPNSVVVNGVNATKLTSQATLSTTKTWWMAPVPTGTSGVIISVTRTGGASGSIQCMMEAFSCYFLKAPFAIVGPQQVFIGASPLSTTIAVEKGGIVAACATTAGTAAGQSDSYSFSGVNTVHSGATADSSSIGAGAANINATNAAFPVGVAWGSSRSTNLHVVSFR